MDGTVLVLASRQQCIFLTVWCSQVAGGEENEHLFHK